MTNKDKVDDMTYEDMNFKKPPVARQIPSVRKPVKKYGELQDFTTSAIIWHLLKRHSTTLWAFLAFGELAVIIWIKL